MFDYGIFMNCNFILVQINAVAIIIYFIIIVFIIVFIIIIITVNP